MMPLVKGLQKVETGEHVVEYVVKYNKRNKKYVLFEKPAIGKGLWKIKGCRDSRKEANALKKSLIEEAGNVH